MGYLALARQWRPRTFTELVGQLHVTRPLQNSLNANRLHHAYLFTGTHGLGKTSLARILTKAINCEQGISGTPCLVCANCLAIQEGRFIDLIEIDAASKTRVEDTRDDILATIPYAPVLGRKKVYLIDEVHMLSQHSFNALLKTLEEPPPHTIFILATTDPHKIPDTVRSRCLQFHLHPLLPDDIVAQLQKILAHENYIEEAGALALIAKASEGSMRDALGMLDQVLASLENKTLDANSVRLLLGYGRTHHSLDILKALAEKNGALLLKLSREIAREGGRFTYVLDELLENLHEIGLAQVIKDIQHLSLSPELAKLALCFLPEEIQLFYHIVLKGKADLPLAPSSIAGFEMTLLKMLAFKPAPLAPLPEMNPTEITSEPEPSFIEDIEEEKKAEVSPTPLAIEEPAITSYEEEMKENWANFIEKLALQGLAKRALEHTAWMRKDGKYLNLEVSKEHEALYTPAIVQRIEKAISLLMKEPISITLNFASSVTSPARQKEALNAQKKETAIQALEEDSDLQKILQSFSAELIETSVKVRET